MELFPAIDEEQLEFIKRIIDDRDYYLLIIGGRYGSLDKDGISYTEKEYDYAVEKGIKVIALLNKNPETLPFNKSEQDASSREKLVKFRAKASTGKVVLFWNNEDELPGQVALSLPVTIKTYPAVGWVRASELPSSDVYKELNDLRKENEFLREAAKNITASSIANIAGLNNWTQITLSLGVRQGFKTIGYFERIINITWGDLFNLVAPSIFINSPEGRIHSIIAKDFAERILETEFNNPQETDKVEAEQFYITDADLEKIRIQFRTLNLITLATVDTSSSGYHGQVLLWGLTQEGERQLLINKAIRQKDN
jgi:hypothetical protein